MEKDGHSLLTYRDGDYKQSFAITLVYNISVSFGSTIALSIIISGSAS